MPLDAAVLDESRAVESLSLADVPQRQPHTTRVLVEPTFFDRSYVINPHMGGTVDKERASSQWEQLRETYERHAESLHVLDPAKRGSAVAADTGVPGPEQRPDMVFVANHALPSPGGEELVLAQMATDERAGEPAHFAAWARDQGYTVSNAPTANFEGMGDALWHPGRRLLWGGYGVRTDRSAYDELAKRLDTPVVPLELTDDRYYHLDLCFAPLSERTTLVVPEALTDKGLETIESLFETVLYAPETEATEQFSVNLDVLGETIVLGATAPQTQTLLEEAGYEVVVTETSEFRKAGGSVCCLSLSIGTPA